MEEELILKQPTDRRLGDNNSLPPGPPGAEYDVEPFETSKPAPKPPTMEKENTASERSSRRRSPSGSPPPARKRKSPSRGRRSPSPPPRGGRGRRSPSPRRNRYRDYSPDRRPRYGGRRSPDRRRSPPRRGGGRDRYRGRGRSSSRSISRSPTPPRRGGGATGRWSPKKKPNTPPQQQSSNLTRQLSQPPPTTNQPPPQYGVMAPPPPQLYGEAYGPPPGYQQYGVPPPQAGFVQSNDAYVAMQAAGTGFNTAYPPPGTWAVDAYGQQQWLPPPTQMQQMPAPQQPPPPALVVQTTTQTQVATNVPPPNVTAAVVNKHAEDATGPLESNPQHDAVAQEAENQRDELKKQRTSYLKKTAVLKKELKMLKEQRKDLHTGGAPASPTTKGFIDENEKLQNQIQKKLNTIENVIDMLTGIIGEENLDKDDEPLDDDDDIILKEAALSSIQKSHSGGGGGGVNERTSGSSQNSNTLNSSNKKKTKTSSSSSDSSSATTSSSSSSSSDSSSSSETEQAVNKDNDDDDNEEDDDSSPERLKKKVIESMKNKDKDIARTKQDLKGPNKKERFNYVFYDPEMHWCQTCNVFPKTAKDYLNHLHTKNHMDRESIETPWHTDMVTDQFPTYENAPTKRTPIRGLTFFVPATAWFCKLCNIWMGDLHCASTHLKSQLHANRYNAFLEENPHYEVNWLADRQIVLNEQKSTPLPQQITSVSTTAAERKKSKKDDDKTNKKRKKKSDKKQKKKKKKSNKKRKKDSDSSSSSSSDSSSSTDSDEPKKKKIPPVTVADLDNPNPAVSIRLSMRKQENIKNEEEQAPPPPQLKMKQQSPATQPPAGGKWTVVQEGVRNKDGEKPQDADDSIIQQWNTVQPVISESEKKLLEQLKGKLKNKSKDEQQSRSSTAQRVESENRDRDRERDKAVERAGGENRNERSDRRDRDGGRDRERDRPRDDRRTSRRSRTRSPTRSRSRGRDYRRNVRRSRSRSRGRMSPRSWRNRNRRNDRSRSRSLRRRSRSPYDRRRRSSRSRSRSGGSSRVEKPVVRPAEFRPRVPEKDKEKDKKSSDNKDKKDKPKPKSSSSSSTSAASAAGGKKLPFIGKMPVFKKQTSGAGGEMGDKTTMDAQQQQQQAAGYMYTMDASGGAFGRPPAPTAAQIQMAMMEDAYGNAPPFHPDAGMMVDYDDLMPDPVQFVNIMGQAPPPPPPQEAEDDKDMLPPGIDVEESEEFVPKPITEAPPPGKGPLPKDLEDALNIIFPGEKKPGGESDNEEEEKNKTKGETQIINDEAVMQPEELAKDGIHLVTFEETSQLGLDEASQMSMNEPLVFNRPPSNPTAANATVISNADMELEDDNSQNQLDTQPPPPAPPHIEPTPKVSEISVTSPQTTAETDKEQTIEMPDIPIPPEIVNSNSTKHEKIPEIPQQVEQQITTNTDIDLADIPQPPASPTESEKNRRQEELDDLAMLGIDADDMAAQCM
ncbi:Zinc finger matrin-type protein [Lucilia cuprina]|uniref:Zinc finger matrin-type protein n=3 Tax=Lucilia cuprina TaxID=7375 RepID=A0A0L0CP71_LUCCU|nr:Zinc finger matrin-type protein [Lucilia cuprina]